MLQNGAFTKKLHAEKTIKVYFRTPEYAVKEPH